MPGGGLGPGGGRGSGGGGWSLAGRTFVRSLVRSFARSDGRKLPPLCSIGHRPLRVCCPKSDQSIDQSVNYR